MNIETRDLWAGAAASSRPVEPSPLRTAGDLLWSAVLGAITTTWVALLLVSM